MTSRKSVFTKPIIYDDALLTSVVAYGESDCVVRMFTRKAGRISTFYRRGRAAKNGNNVPQAPALATVGLIESEQNLLRLVSCEIAPQAYCSSSLKMFGYGVYIAELVEKLLAEEDRAEEIFEVVEEAFWELANQNMNAPMLRAFELKLLDFCGYLPELPHDAQNIVAFDQVASRFVKEANDHSFAFTPNAIKLAQAMLIAKLGTVTYGEDDELLMLGRIFQSRLKLMGIFPLKSVTFLKNLSGR